MAFLSDLSVYNDALMLVGQRQLASLTEDREPRYLLDHVMDMGAVDYCLQIVQPRSATRTVKLATPTVSTVHDLDSVHELPADFLKVVGVYSDSKLDQPISRYILDGSTLVCEYDTVFLRYTSNSSTIVTWSPVFARVVSAYLAQEIALKLSPDVYEVLVAKFTERAGTARQLEGEQEPQKRSAATTVTLTNSWRHIYNDALLILGLDEITSNTDDSDRRSKLDRTLDAGLVSGLLEETGWNFGMRSERIQYDPSLEPEWGYAYVFGKPADMHRLDGIYMDEHFLHALKDYQDEGDRWFANYDTIYVSYVSRDWLTQVENWPTFFRRLVAARMAKDAAASLKADVAVAVDEYARRLHDATSNDAIAGPPRVIREGSWNRARHSGYRNRGRP